MKLKKKCFPQKMVSSIDISKWKKIWKNSVKITIKWLWIYMKKISEDIWTNCDVYQSLFPILLQFWAFKWGILPDFFFFSLRGEAISVSVAFEVSPSPSEKVRFPSVSSPLNVWSPEIYIENIRIKMSFMFYFKINKKINVTRTKQKK